jgi:hypothetical protein
MYILQNIDSVIDNTAAIPETLNEKLNKILMVIQVVEQSTSDCKVKGLNPVAAAGTE